MPPVNADPGVGYPISVGAGLLRKAGEHLSHLPPETRLAVITDTTVEPLYAGRLLEGLGRKAEVFAISPGEAIKTRDTWANITDQLLDAGFGRDSTLLALGGGVIGDLTGFIAGTYLRGIPYVQFPTTLLAMVDASIGGKTGVDTAAGKNLVGVFHRPSTVIIDTQTLATLPLNHLRSGFAEVIKHGVVADGSYFAMVADAVGDLASPQGLNGDSLLAVIAGSVRIKAAVVSGDEMETGRRRILNFGHTIGHAVEAASGYSLLHGEAVAIGMALESRLAERAQIAETGTSSRINEVLTKAGLPRQIPEGISIDSILKLMGSDKKNRGGAIEFALPTQVGRMFEAGGRWSIPVEMGLVREVLHEKN